MRTITLAGPAKNALGSSLMQAVHDQVKAASGEPLLLTGDGDAFSAGLNLKEVLNADDDSMRAFHHLLEETIAALYHYPGPTAAAVNGHAIAGGAILALVCDRRIATTNPKARIGLNEVSLGLQFPPRLLGMVTDCIPRRHQIEVLLGAGLFGPQDSVRLGMVDALADDPVAAATAWLKICGAHPDGAYAAGKAQLRPPIPLTDAQRTHFDTVVLPGWTSESVKARIGGFFKKK
jgi:enoyl-CoA hydratase/carnithine racemase